MRKKGKISICVNEEDEGVEIYIYIYSYGSVLLPSQVVELFLWNTESLRLVLLASFCSKHAHSFTRYWNTWFSGKY